MRIEINPRSLPNLEDICEVLYKLHPLVLNRLIEIKRTFGNILGFINLDNLSQEEREFLANHNKEEDEDPLKVLNNYKEEILKDKGYQMENEDPSKLLNSYKFHNFIKYLQLDTYEYIPIKISVEVEDPVIGRKIRELVEELEKTRAPEQYYFNKREMDADAYFAEGYGLTMNEEQQKKLDDFFNGEDVKALEELLRKEKLYQ